MRSPYAYLSMPLATQTAAKKRRRKRYMKRLLLWLARAMVSHPRYPEAYYADSHERYEDMKAQIAFYRGRFLL